MDSTVASGSCRPKTRYRHGDGSGPLMSSTEDHICSRSACLHSKFPMYSYGELSALVWNNSGTLLGSL
jgi:hypothetical protein